MTESEGGLVAWSVRGATRLWRAFAVIAAVCGLLAVAGPASADSWQWSPAYTVADGANGSMSGISCPTTTLCVSAAEVGNPDSGGTDDVLWTTDPAAGSSSWHEAPLETTIQPSLGTTQGEAIDGVSCEPVGGIVECALSDGFGNLFETTNPTGGTSAWGKSTPEGPPDQVGLSTLSCWSAWCGVLDAEGNAVMTLGGNVQSNQSNVFDLPEDPTGGQLSISCNASAFCAATDMSNTVVWTTTATSQPADWKTGNVSGNVDLDSIACPSTTLCVASEGQQSFTDGAIGVSHDPAGGAGTWSSFDIPGVSAVFFAATCQSATLCAVGGGKVVATSTDPAAQASAWQTSSVPISGGVSGLSCPTSTECVALGGNSGQISVGHPGSGTGPTPPVGGSGKPTAGRATVTATGADVPVSCSGATGATCTVTGALTATETLKGGKVIAVTARKHKTVKKRVVFGTVTVTVASGHASTLKLGLNAAGKRLLASRHKLPVELVLTDKVAGKTTTLATDKLTFKSKKKKKH